MNYYSQMNFEIATVFRTNKVDSSKVCTVNILQKMKI